MRRFEETRHGVPYGFLSRRLWAHALIRSSRYGEVAGTDSVYCENHSGWCEWRFSFTLRLPSRQHPVFDGWAAINAEWGHEQDKLVTRVSSRPGHWRQGYGIHSHPERSRY